MPNYTIGLDLGQVRDYSALVVAERLKFLEGRSRETSFDEDAGYHESEAYFIRHIQRFELGTPYPTVVDTVSELIQTSELRGNTLLVFDRTGVGGAVADLFREAYQRHKLGPHWPLGVNLTGGFSHRGAARGSYCTTAHKGDVVQRLYLLFDQGRIKAPLGLPGHEDLIKEIRAFRPKQNAQTGNLSYEAERESDHDDLVIALALAVWHPHQFADPRHLFGSLHGNATAV